MIEDLLEKALEFALKAHWGQRDKAGQPYILHPLRVMFNVEQPLAKIVALLHDVLEDTAVTANDLRSAGFTEEIIQAVKVLTRESNEDYFEYIRRIKVNPLARQVKIADLKDNLDVTRLSTFTPTDQQRVQKYLTALKVLKQEA